MTHPDRLLREIHHAHAEVQSSIITRRHHPSFGYTKTYIRGQVARLFALLEAHILVTGGWTGGGPVLDGVKVEHGRSLNLTGIEELRREWLS